jgi:hypothetical protein
MLFFAQPTPGWLHSLSVTHMGAKGGYREEAVGRLFYATHRIGRRPSMEISCTVSVCIGLVSSCTTARVCPPSPPCKSG